MNKKKSKPEMVVVVRRERVVLRDGKTRDIVCYRIESAKPDSAGAMEQSKNE